MKISFLILMLLLFLPITAFAEIDANEIVKKADLKRGPGNVPHSFNVTITDQDDKKEVFHVSFKDINSSLTEQKEPARAMGRKILMKDYDIWLYTPNIKKALRISLEQKLTGQVSNGDIARTNYAEDYEATILKTDSTNYLLNLKAKNNKVTYGKIEYLVSKKDFTPLEATFFALSGKALKKAIFTDLKIILGQGRTTKMIIQDYLQKNKNSTMVFSDYKFEKFNESLFNKEGMEF
jgi:outer membrane lipoprotein-sorting protein